MILIIYNLALVVALIVALPWWLVRMMTTEKYREGLLARLGVVPAYLRKSADAGKPVLWLHAVSVGEVLAVSRLVGELEAAHPDHRLLISTTTLTGQRLARERFGAERVFYSPLDLPWAIRAYLNCLKPQMLVLTETEFWPNLLAGCARRRIPVAVVNARISDRSWPRYQKLRSLWRPFLEGLGPVLAQSEVDADRLRALGCRDQAVVTTGNLKFDVRAVHEAEATVLLKSLAGGRRILVAGSTLEGEEEALLAVWKELIAADDRLVMVLAPRHPERFAAVISLLEASGLHWCRRTAWRGNQAGEIAALRMGEVVLLDSIGELASIYSLAQAAFVGGSLIPAGGHNPLEPAQFALPVTMGPNYENFRTIVEDLRLHEALQIADKENLATVLRQLLYAPEARKMGERARQVFESQAGATARCVAALGKNLGCGRMERSQ